MKKRILSLLLVCCMCLSMVPASAFAWDYVIYCDYCGELCGDDYICSGGDHCSEDSGRACYLEHHCEECNECVEDEVCFLCGICYSCADTCSEGDSHACFRCHLEEGMACEDCYECFAERPESKCEMCGRCIPCVGTCSEGSEHACLGCHLDENMACPDCHQCYVETSVTFCEECYVCIDCAGAFCENCTRCDACAEICDHCNELCLECHESDDEVCPYCGGCSGGDPMCVNCGGCTWCCWICDSCELCGECIYDFEAHCPLCDLCYEEEDRCYSGGEHCAICCDANGWLCPNCGECTEACGYELVCRDCGVCEGCSDFCSSCGDFCLECLMYEESLHCPGCGVCYEEVKSCYECGLCEDCAQICPSCDDCCVECALLLGYHCSVCGESCSSIGMKLCSVCDICEECADLCASCGMCVTCATAAEKHCLKCGACSDDVSLCWCGVCVECLGDKWCESCGGCDECIAAGFDDFHCPDCHQCFTDEAEPCGRLCGRCVDCCKCRLLCAVTFEPGTGSGSMSSAVVYGKYQLPRCTFTPPVKSVFLAWRVGGNYYNAGDIITVTQDTVIQAVWTKLMSGSYCVTYNGNGGSGTMKVVSGVSGVFTLPACGYTAPAGKSFKAYQIGGVEYQPGDIVNITSNTIVVVLWKNTPLHTCRIEFVEKVKPTCTLPGKEAYYKCADCGRFYEDAQGTVEIKLFAAWGNIPKLEHTASNWKYDKDNHWKVCTAGCNAVIDNSKAAHALTAGKCSVCGYIEKLSAPAPKIYNKSATGQPYMYWDAVEGAAKYEVWRATSSGGTYSRMYTTTSTSYNNTSAVAGKTYYYKVRAIDASGNAGEFSIVKSITCDLAQPVNTKISIKAENGKPYLTWDAVKGATGYEIWRATSSSGTYTKMYTTSQTYYTNTSAKPSTTYYYKVRAVMSGNSYATSAYSATRSITCDCAAPSISITVKADNGKPYLTWKAVDGATKYEIYRATSKDGTYTKMYTTSSLYYTNTSAKPGTTYYYKIKALGTSSYATSAFSNIRSITCDCARPVVTITTNSAGKPYLDWNSVDGAVKYEIWRATSADGTYTKMYTTSSSYYTNTSAKSGTTYYYKVIALGSTSYANSAYSNIVSVKCK